VPAAGVYLLRETIDAGRIPAWPREAGDKTKLDRVFADAEHNRDRRGRSFGLDRSGNGVGRGDHRHTTAHQFSHQFRQAIELALQPMVLDRHLLALDVAAFTKPFAERGDRARCGIGRPAADEPDHRHRPLLRPRHHRPRRRAAEPAD
jgi:hypothetical protein